MVRNDFYIEVRPNNSDNDVDDAEWAVLLMDLNQFLEHYKMHLKDDVPQPKKFGAYLENKND